MAKEPAFRPTEFIPYDGERPFLPIPSVQPPMAFLEHFALDCELGEFACLVSIITGDSHDALRFDYEMARWLREEFFYARSFTANFLVPALIETLRNPRFFCENLWPNHPKGGHYSDWEQLNELIASNPRARAEELPVPFYADEEKRRDRVVSVLVEAGFLAFPALLQAALEDHPRLREDAQRALVSIVVNAATKYSPLVNFMGLLQEGLARLAPAIVLFCAAARNASTENPLSFKELAARLINQPGYDGLAVSASSLRLGLAALERVLSEYLRRPVTLIDRVTGRKGSLTAEGHIFYLLAQVALFQFAEYRSQIEELGIQAVPAPFPPSLFEDRE